MSDATQRLIEYNGNPYRAATNPRGLDGADGGVSGFEVNLPQALNDVGTAANEVAAGTETAKAWATKTDAPVAGGEYSAKYHAIQAAGNAITATSAATTATTKATEAASAALAAANAAAAVTLPVPTAGDTGKPLEWGGGGWGVGGSPPLYRGKHTLWVPAGAFVPRATSGAGRGAAETSTAHITRRTLDFDAATQEYAQTTLAMPKSWDRGAITFQVLWLSTAASGAVVWSAQAVAVGDGDALDAAFGTAATITDAVTAANAVNVSGESGALTVAGSPQTGDLTVFQLYRAAADAADTLAGDALLLGVRIFYTKSAGNDA